MSKIVKIDASDDDDSFEANLQDMQWLQWLAQRLLQLRGHLRDNLTTLSAVRKLGDRFPAAAEPANRQSQDTRARVRGAFGDWMTVWTHALAQHLRDTEMLISQSQGCAELVREPSPPFISFLFLSSSPSLRPRSPHHPFP